MAKCTLTSLSFSSFDRRKIQANFQGGDVSSDGGILLLRQMDRRLGLTKKLAEVLKDPRQAHLIRHHLVHLLRQRIYGISLGYEDLNDHNCLRKDMAWQTAIERKEPLASSPTLCRMENRADRQAAWAMHEVMVEQFISSFKEAPSELILDFDATDDPLHGNQEGRAFHGYYGHWCYLPLYIFCGEQLLVSYLRTSNQDSAKHAWAILKLLSKRLREAFPEVKIIFRADSGFCRWKMLRWCEHHDIGYIVGLAKNARLLAQIEKPLQEAQQSYQIKQEKQRHFGWISYKAKSWDKERQIIYKAEYHDKGANPRFVITNLQAEAQVLYDKVYCGRGEMENRIKEQQLGLFADRTSSGQWWSNQFRLLLSSMAYLLIEGIRRYGLAGSQLARAQVSTIRLKLFKIGTVILQNTRRIRFLYSSSYPYKEVFEKALTQISSS